METKKLHAAAQIAQEGAMKDIDNYLSKHEDPEDIELYFCGPPMMNKAVQKMGEDFGLDPDKIKI